MFIYHPTLNTTELKEAKCTEYITAWKLKGLFKYIIYTQILNHYLILYHLR